MSCVEYVYLLQHQAGSQTEISKVLIFLWLGVDTTQSVRGGEYGKKEDATRRDCRAAPIVRLLIKG